MRIDSIADSMAYFGYGFFVGAPIGCLGAYILKPFINSISPLGVALTCGLINAIAIAVLVRSLNVPNDNDFAFLLASYPVGLIAGNLLRLNVRILNPTASVCIAGIILIPIAITAFFCSIALWGEIERRRRRRHPGIFRR